MVIHQGDVYWLTFRGSGSEPEARRPALVIQHDRYNRSALRTTVVVAITTNLRLAAKPGNVSLRRGEGGLPERSVVNVTQPQTVDRDRLVAKLGSLRRARLDEVLRGIALVVGLEAADST